MSTASASTPTTVGLYGLGLALATSLRDDPALASRVVWRPSEDEATVDGAADIAVIGDRDGAPRQTVDWILARPGGEATRFLIVAAGDSPEAFQDLLDGDRLIFMTATPPDPRVVAALLSAAVDGSRGEARRPSAEMATSVRRLASSTDLASALRVATRDAAAQVEASSCSGWLLMADGHSLVSPRAGGDLEASAAAGLTSFAALTGQIVRVETASSDPRFDPDVDTPEASDSDSAGDERLLAAPLIVGTRPVGALGALRPPDAPAFSDVEARRLADYATRIAPLLLGLLGERRAAESGVGAGVFRRAALDHHSRGTRRDGRPLELAPVWLTHTYRLLLALLAVALLFVVFGRHADYATGPAVIQIDDRLVVTSPISGTAVGIEVAPGDQVEAGQLLARFYDQREANALRRLRRELEAQLAERLRDPSDESTAPSVAALRAEVDLAEARLEERSLRAPRAGRVRDLRVRSGQAIQPGDAVLSLAAIDGSSRVEVLALLPGRARPQLAAGTALRLELTGYPYAYQHLVIDRVGNEILGPAEAMRALPPGVADALQPSEPVVFVHARLDGDHFKVGDQRLAFHDGMPGRVEARIRSERLLFTLVPGLRALFGGSGGAS